MKDYEKKFTEYLARHGLKLTQQRRAILDEVFSRHEHFKAEDMLHEMRSRGLSVSKATLYRTLALLVESGLLREEVFGERHAHYEHIYGHEHHDHLICISCGRIEEFHNEEIEKLQKQVCKENTFTPVGHKMEIYGYCRRCRKKTP